MTSKKPKRIQGATPKSAMKRFAVFSGDRFYPNGGWSDFQSSYPTLAAAQQASAPGTWRQIVDLTTGQIVEQNP